MRLIECDAPYGRVDSKKQESPMGIVKEFVKSGMKCAEVADWSYSTPAGLVSALYLVIYRKDLKGIRVARRSGHVFLLRD